MTRPYLAIATSTMLMLNAMSAFNLHAAERSPDETVRAFNQALSQRNLDAALVLVAAGSVQFTLRSAHSDMPSAGSGSVTGDLKAHWKAIGPVVFGSTAAYNRNPKITSSRIDGDLATVWTSTTTETVGKNGGKRSDSFSEIYMLVHTASGWQIGAVADNRGANRFNAAAAPPASGGR
jgi:hypothetical protein